MLTKSQARKQKAGARKSLGKIAAGIKSSGYNKLNRIARITETPVKTLRVLIKK
jgi:hypothetical protein